MALRGKVRIGYTPDGKPIDKNVSGDTPEALETAKQACKEHFLYGRQIPEDQLFYEYAENWYRLKKEPFISSASRSSYKPMFVKHLLPVFGLQHLTAIDANQLQAFLNEFAGASKSTITLCVGILKNIFSCAYAEGIIPRDPSVALVRPKSLTRNERRPLTTDETKRILHTAESSGRASPGGAVLHRRPSR